MDPSKSKSEPCIQSTTKLSDLPDEIIPLLARHLSLGSLLNLTSTCRRYFLILKNDSRLLYIIYFKKYPLLPLSFLAACSSARLRQATIEKRHLWIRWSSGSPTFTSQVQYEDPYLFGRSRGRLNLRLNKGRVELLQKGLTFYPKANPGRLIEYRMNGDVDSRLVGVTSDGFLWNLNGTLMASDVKAYDLCKLKGTTACIVVRNSRPCVAQLIANNNSRSVPFYQFKLPEPIQAIYRWHGMTLNSLEGYIARTNKGIYGLRLPRATKEAYTAADFSAPWRSVRGKVFPLKFSWPHHIIVPCNDLVLVSDGYHLEATDTRGKVIHVAGTLGNRHSFDPTKISLPVTSIHFANTENLYIRPEGPVHQISQYRWMLITDFKGRLHDGWYAHYSPASHGAFLQLARPLRQTSGSEVQGVKHLISVTPEFPNGANQVELQYLRIPPESSGNTGVVHPSDSPRTSISSPPGSPAFLSGSSYDSDSEMDADDVDELRAEFP